MKATVIGVLAGITISAAVGAGCIVNHSNECERYQRLTQSQPIDWDQSLAQGRYVRAPLVEPLQIDKYPGDPCGGITGGDVINSVLAGMLIFALIVIPSAVFRGIFPRGSHD